MATLDSADFLMKCLVQWNRLVMFFGTIWDFLLDAACLYLQFSFSFLVAHTGFLSCRGLHPNSLLPVQLGNGF